MGGFRIGFVLRVVRMAVFVSSTCVFALGGAIVGAITGAVTGQTTETGFCRGAGIGAISGAVVAVELLESLIEGESSSKIALIGSLINGKVFREWVSPAMLKAYQWQINSMETSYGETSDIYDVGGIKGVSFTFINKLPVFNFTHSEMMATCDDFCCTICLQARSLQTDKLRIVNILVNGGIYFIQVCLWIYLWINDNSVVEAIGKIFIAVVSFAAAPSFLLYGGKLFFMLRHFPIESKGRRKKLHEVGSVTAICFTCFLIRCFVDELSAFESYASLDVLYHPVLNFIYYMLAEVLPSALVLYILRKLPPKRISAQYHPIH